MTRRIAMIGAGSPSLSTALLVGASWPLVARGEHEHAARTLAAACGIRRPPERKAHRCALPGCNHTTTHNGGYCCANHCREHRQRQRGGLAGAYPVNNNGRPPLTWEGANGPCEEAHGRQCRCHKCVANNGVTGVTTAGRNVP